MRKPATGTLYMNMKQFGMAHHDNNNNNNDNNIKQLSRKEKTDILINGAN